MNSCGGSVSIVTMLPPTPMSWPAVGPPSPFSLLSSGYWGQSSFTDFCLVPWLRICRGVLPLPNICSWCDTYLSTSDNLSLPLLFMGPVSLLQGSQEPTTECCSELLIISWLSKLLGNLLLQNLIWGYIK